ncbi:hypothetical protein C5N14_10995 [Micromonospora sp. MW-13]|uniref:hypothetical protein n=1 Tax=Micromonospora sp. MW-13 TaxID=2094022 RepID=UPI000E443432|nr:hypothetical protein [Micromonospora sp. MW-13]RGC69068.1 hypothetical protein C5N14_10995 [Micromonospora sp. MW-13]
MFGRGNKQLDAAVRELAEADTLAFGGVGFAGTVLPATEAYREVERQLDAHPKQARRKVDWLLEHGSPAGRAYAATLLGRNDPAAARTAWESLRGAEGEITTFAGCVMGRTTLGEYAAGQLAAGGRPVADP